MLLITPSFIVVVFARLIEIIPCDAIMKPNLYFNAYLTLTLLMIRRNLFVVVLRKREVHVDRHSTTTVVMCIGLNDHWKRDTGHCKLVLTATHLYDTPTRHTYMTHLHDTPTRHTYTTHLHDTPTRHTYTTHLHDTLTRHTNTTHLHDTPTRHTYTTHLHATFALIVALGIN